MGKGLRWTEDFARQRGVDGPGCPVAAKRGRGKGKGAGRARSPLEEALAAQMSLAGFPVPVTEWRFHQERRWRFDFAWPDRKLAVEVEGGVYTAGRHTRIGGFEADAEKYNAAALLGWRVLRVTAKQIASGQALNWIEQALQAPQEAA